MFFHVIVTTECNSQCLYCYGEAVQDTDNTILDDQVDYSLPRRIAYDVKALNSFCRQDPDCVVTFYGGEPLMCVKDVRNIMDNVEVRSFMIQTNGLLLDRLGRDYVNRFHTILVSLDGDEKLTDYYRGAGTFRKVVDNMKLIKRNGFKGELIARMTVMESTDILSQVRWLVQNEEFPFSSVHWQLNAGFWTNDFARRDFSRWSREYNLGIRKLAEFWVDYMENHQIVLRLYPFLGVAQSLLSEEKQTLLRCGSGWINYAIQTDGHVIPCPAMWGLNKYYLGHIGASYPLGLRKIFVEEPCISCDSSSLCGGRCLYANIMKRWSQEAYSKVCVTVQNLIQAVQDQMPRIQQLIHSGKIRSRNFEYIKYNGCEIIP